MSRYENGVKCEFCGERGFKSPADLAEHLEDAHVRANVEFGGRCEDFPCCGHEPGDCPQFSSESGYLPYRCLGCGKRIRRGSANDRSSSYCGSCLDNGRYACTCGTDEYSGHVGCEYHDRMRDMEDDDDGDGDVSHDCGICGEGNCNCGEEGFDNCVGCVSCQRAG